MAFPEANTPKRDPYDNPMRDPTGTDPHSHMSNWIWVLSLAVAALIGFFIFNSMYGAPKPLSDTSTSQRVEPKSTPEPTQPSPQSK